MQFKTVKKEIIIQYPLCQCGEGEYRLFGVSRNRLYYYRCDNCGDIIETSAKYPIVLGLTGKELKDIRG